MSRLVGEEYVQHYSSKRANMGRAWQQAVHKLAFLFRTEFQAILRLLLYAWTGSGFGSDLVVCGRITIVPGVPV